MARRVGYWKEFYQKHKDKIKLRVSKNQKEKREYYTTYGRNRRHKLKDGLVRSYKYRTKEEHYKIDLANNSLYRARKLKRTVQWADLNAIKQFYLNCPIGYHVDHVIPLKGKFVSGLHVLTNLQYLTAYENLTKLNKFVDVQH